MKARTLVSFCLISGLAAVSQTAPPSQKVAPDSVKPPIARAAPARPKASAQRPAASAAAKAPATQAKAPGKRDPFISPVREGGPGGGPACTVGKKCLAIDTIQLRGIVRARSGSIAVVESSTRKVTYFLRESDPVFNGYVMKITADSVMFRENVVDRAGRQSTREIVKRVSAPPV